MAQERSTIVMMNLKNKQSLILPWQKQVTNVKKKIATKNVLFSTDLLPFFPDLRSDKWIARR